ncbi:MAG TPA: SDR family NAD(P)-dependent oxidoreductase, partial [Flavisolibacter sp.]|nr:SDR family NAD(P)-dependent oxidoreductase [Flavisolibacter sp.]
MAFALITGASKGIGKAMAFELAASGYNLALVARSEDLLKQAAEEIQTKYKVEVRYLALDLSSLPAAQQVFDWSQQQRLDVSILVNNA